MANNQIKTKSNYSKHILELFFALSKLNSFKKSLSTFIYSLT